MKFDFSKVVFIKLYILGFRVIFDEMLVMTVILELLLISVQCHCQ